MRKPKTSKLGKYRDLVLAITIFLFLDMGVLAFNYYTSRLIAADTARINTAGELRMYSQQLAKAVLTLNYELANQQPTQTSLAQISESHQAFSEAIERLKSGLHEATGEGISTVANSEAKEQLEELQNIWAPLGREAVTLLGIKEPGVNDVTSIANLVFARNVRLMQLAGDLTETLESSALERSSTLQTIQLVAIGLAFLNFIFIIFKFVRSLQASDRIAEEARRETTRILETVQEGLFLVDREGRIGHQHSQTLFDMLGKSLAPGDNVLAFLMERIEEKHRESVKDFFDVLFNKKVKPSLLKQLNPLQEIAFVPQDGKTRYLNFEFDQVKSGDQVEQLLVTVFDVTEKVTLARDLAHAEQRVKTEVDALLALLDHDPATVDSFLRGAEARLASINSQLASVRPEGLAYRKLVNVVARDVHGVKGEAAALGLRAIETEIHKFESTLAPLRNRDDLTGDDLIPVAVAMNDVHEATAKVWQVIERVQHYANGEKRAAGDTDSELRELMSQIEHLTLRVASDLNKKAKIEIAAPPELKLPGSVLAFLRTTLPQLVRNAVAHGIEPAEERQRQGKPQEGTISCMITCDAEGTLLISVQDDGYGLSPQALRQTFAENGTLSAEEAASLSDEQIVAKIFQPGFSAIAEPGIHAGRGDGLALVHDMISRWGGTLKISSRPNTYTRFSLQLDKEAWQCA